MSECLSSCGVPFSFTHLYTLSLLQHLIYESGEMFEVAILWHCAVILRWWWLKHPHSHTYLYVGVGLLLLDWVIVSISEWYCMSIARFKGWVVRGESCTSIWLSLYAPHTEASSTWSALQLASWLTSLHALDCGALCLQAITSTTDALIHSLAHLLDLWSVSEWVSVVVVAEGVVVLNLLGRGAAR
jgi:hypothetical protein